MKLDFRQLESSFFTVYTMLSMLDNALKFALSKEKAPNYKNS